MYKHAEKKSHNKSMAYEQTNYSELNPVHNMSIDSALFRKNSYQLEKKRKAKILNSQTKKIKNKRSATPGIHSGNYLNSKKLIIIISVNIANLFNSARTSAIYVPTNKKQQFNKAKIWLRNNSLDYYL